MTPVTNFDEWNEYVLNHPNGTFYLLSFWKDAIEKAFKIKNRYFIAKKDGKPCGIIPLFVVHTIALKKVSISIPYGGFYAGILANDEKTRDRLLEFAVSFSKHNGSEYLELRYLDDQHFNLPKQELYVTYIKELGKDDETILKSIPRKSRASIRNGYKKFNLYSKVDRNVDILYELYVKNKRNLGSPIFPKVFFYQLLESSGEKSGILTIYYKSIPVSSVIFFSFRDTIIPYFSGADNSYNYTNMNNVMYYELMKYALKNGYKFFDFGRSRKNTGSGNFKKNMGFEAKQLHFYFYMHKQGNVPNNSPSNSKFQLIINTWSKLPLFITKLLGPQLMKLFP